MSNLKDIVVQQAQACGFDLVGVTGAEDFADDREAALERIQDGRMDGLPWYTESRVMRGTSPSELLPGARSVICLGLSYWGSEESERPSTSSGRKDGGSGRTDESSEKRHGGIALRDESSGKRHGGIALREGSNGLEDESNGRTEGRGGVRGLDSRLRGSGGNEGSAGRVARYAWVRDYHRVMKRRMREFVRSVERELGAEIAARWYVDDGPMLDRAAANRAGLGWFGKNTNILTPEFGSWVFLGQVITDLELEADAPLKKSCGSCVRCIDDCPTGALVAPYVLDNARCISYLTIENRGPIPRELRPMMGDWVFGCDICQDVCPVNRKAREASQPIAFPVARERSGRVSTGTQSGGLASLDLVDLLRMSDEDFLARFAGTSIMRAKRQGMQRNACVALGNLGDRAAVPVLSDALRHGDPLVRGHAAWALGRIGGEAASRALMQAAADESDPEVLEEIVTAQRVMAPGGFLPPDAEQPPCKP